MSNKNSLVIPSNGEVDSHTDLQSGVIVFDKERRQKLIQILRKMPAILGVAKKLSGEKVYQAHFHPEVLKRIKDGSARLDDKGNGFFSSSIRDVKTGLFIDNVDLLEVTPDLLNSINELATQQTLADIVHRLEVIDEKITDVLQGQFNDRLAEVESGIHLYEQALAASDPDLRRDLMVSAIQNLNDGRNKLIKSTDFSFIDKLSRNRLGMLFSRHWDIPEYVQSKAKLVVKATHAIVEATRYLVMAYSDLNELDALRISLKQVENEVKFFQDKTGEIVRWLPPTSNLHESLTSISKGILPSINDLYEISQKSMVIEFQPTEILHPEGV